MSQPKKPAVFLDRDGTLIDDGGYLSSPDQLDWFPETIESLQRLQEHFTLFVITNQAGIGLGKTTAEEVASVNQALIDYLAGHKIKIAKVFVCPHAPDQDCECRKPKQLFAEQAKAEFNIDLARSYTIGDHPCDIEFAWAHGGRGLYVLTGHGARHRDEIFSGATVVNHIGEATAWILSMQAQPAIQDSSAANIQRAAGRIRQSELVAFPTETVYGLGANAMDPLAVKKIFELKGRPQEHPLIVHLANSALLPEWASDISEKAKQLAESFWPGPMTLIMKRNEQVPDEVTGGLETVGLRVPENPIAQSLLQESGLGIAAPSANKFGKVSPTQAKHVWDEFQDDSLMILDGGSSEVGLESTIIDVSSAEIAILRPGAITLEMIESVIGAVAAEGNDNSPAAPGRLQSHYAPATQLHVIQPDALVAAIEAYQQAHPDHKIGVLAEEFSSENENVSLIPFPNDPEQQAKCLYETLRELDRLDIHTAYVCLPDPDGIGSAVIDRLLKASAPKETA